MFYFQAKFLAQTPILLRDIEVKLPYCIDAARSLHLPRQTDVNLWTFELTPTTLYSPWSSKPAERKHKQIHEHMSDEEWHIKEETLLNNTFHTYIIILLPCAHKSL